MKKPISAVASKPVQVRLSLFALSLVVSSILFGAVAGAQEKSAESSHIPGWVVIPVEEYRVLRAKAYPVEHDPEPPPLDATLTRVDYDLHGPGLDASAPSPPAGCPRSAHPRFR